MCLYLLKTYILWYIFLMLFSVLSHILTSYSKRFQTHSFGECAYDILRKMLSIDQLGLSRGILLFAFAFPLYDWFNTQQTRAQLLLRIVLSLFCFISFLYIQWDDTITLRLSSIHLYDLPLILISFLTYCFCNIYIGAYTSNKNIVVAVKLLNIIVAPLVIIKSKKAWSMYILFVWCILIGSFLGV